MTRRHDVLELVRRSASLADEEMHALDRRDAELVARDAARCTELIPALVTPAHATLQARASRQLDDLPRVPNAGALIDGLPDGARRAALALLYRDALDEPLFAALYAPWAELFEDDPRFVAALWTDEADRIREDWISLPAAAFRQEARRIRA